MKRHASALEELDRVEQRLSEVEPARAQLIEKLASIEGQLTELDRLKRRLMRRQEHLRIKESTRIKAGTWRTRWVRSRRSLAPDELDAERMILAAAEKVRRARVGFGKGVTRPHGRATSKTARE
jgi:hypothetical protein